MSRDGKKAVCHAGDPSRVDVDNKRGGGLPPWCPTRLLVIHSHRQPGRELTVVDCHYGQTNSNVLRTAESTLSSTQVDVSVVRRSK